MRMIPIFRHKLQLAEMTGSFVLVRSSHTRTRDAHRSIEQIMKLVFQFIAEIMVYGKLAAIKAANKKPAILAKEIPNLFICFFVKNVFV